MGNNNRCVFIVLSDTKVVDHDENLLNDTYRMNMIRWHQPKLYDKIINGKIGDKVGDNNQLLVKTKYGWKERYWNGKYNVNKFAVGIKEEYFDPSF